MNTEGSRKLFQAIEGEEYLHKDKELSEMSDGNLLAHLRWVRSQIKELIQARNIALTRQDKTPVQNYIEKLFAYINKIHAEFERRGKKIEPEEN